MATYDFACASCGSFEVRRAMAHAADPAACPRCGAPGRRVYAPPRLARTDAPMRRALDAEERSAHVPAVVGGPGAGRPLGHLHGHGHAHGPAHAPPWTVGG